MRVHLLHGFNVSDGGANTTDRLIPFFASAGHEVVQHDYGWFGLLQVRLLNGRVADNVIEAAQDGDIGCGHSNGCAILLDAAWRSPKLRGLILVNPALDRDADFPDSLDWVHVYHNRGDKPVKWARWLPWHLWGDMGNVGYCGQDCRVRNFSGDALPPKLCGHSDIFSAGKIGGWGGRLVAAVPSKL